MLSTKIIKQLIKINNKKQVIPDEEIFLDNIVKNLEKINLPTKESNLYKILYDILSISISDNDKYSINNLKNNDLEVLYLNIDLLKNLSIKTRILALYYEKKLMNKNKNSEEVILKLINYYDQMLTNIVKLKTIKINEKASYIINIIEHYSKILRNHSQQNTFINQEDNLINNVLSLPTNISFAAIRHIRPSNTKQNQTIIDYLKNTTINNKYYLLIELDKNNKDTYKEELALSYEKEAENEFKINNNIFVANGYFIKALQLYKETNNQPKQDKVQTQINNLKPLVSKCFSNQKPIEIPIDKTAIQDLLRPIQNTNDFYEALRILFYQLTLPTENNINNVTKNNSNLSSYFHNIFYNYYGEISKVNPNKTDDDINISKKQLSMSNLYKLYDGGILQNSLNIINDKFYFNMDTLIPLIQHNPYIKGKEYSILSGIFAFLKFDFISASYLLIPQIEEYLRRILTNAGINVSILEQKNVEKKRINISDLLEECNTNNLINKNDFFHLDYLLCKENIRDNLAHGKYADAECQSETSICLLHIFIKQLIKFSYMPDNSTIKIF